MSQSTESPPQTHEPSRSHSKRTIYTMYISDARNVYRSQKEKPSLSERDLVESHLFYVIQVAREYRNLGIPLEDLLAEGNLGLMEAAGRFDRTRGVKFISYATWWIRKRIWDLVARQVNLVRVPKYRLERLRRFRAAERTLRSSLGRPPTLEEIAGECRFSLAEAESLRNQPQRELSLETVINTDSGLRLEDVLAERSSRAPDSNLFRENSESSLLHFLDHLSPRQREILSMHFGLGGRRPATLAEIGRQLGVSRERVRQLERQGLTRLRRLMTPEKHSETA